MWVWVCQAGVDLRFSHLRFWNERWKCIVCNWQPPIHRTHGSMAYLSFTTEIWATTDAGWHLESCLIFFRTFLTVRVSFDFKKLSSALISIFGPPKMGGWGYGPPPCPPSLGSVTVRVGEGRGCDRICFLSCKCSLWKWLLPTDVQ